MSQIQVTNLTFGYEGSVEEIFEEVSFQIDTNWKIGLIGRNGKGKTTFLRLLQGKYAYQGSINKSVFVDYFPYEIPKEWEELCVSEWLEELKAGCEEWRVICELALLQADAALLYQPWKTLSHGEQTKILLAVLFSGENDFLLVDEPTNHLDLEAREVVRQYLSNKKGFLLVSHDRDLLDACIDHVLVLNRKSIEVQNGNFSSWWENKQRKDHFSEMENEKHMREISALKRTAERSSRWAEKNENTKIGFNPLKEHDRFLDTRAYIGAKTKKMQARVKQYENRINREIKEREGLLEDIEKPVSLKLDPLSFYKERLILATDLSVRYEGKEEPVFEHVKFELMRGERVFLHGKNGCGKSTLIKLILALRGNQDKYGIKKERFHDLKKMENAQNEKNIDISKSREIKTMSDIKIQAGSMEVPSGLIISYVNQDTSFLHGNLKSFCREQNLEESMLLTLLRQLDMERSQFVKNLETFSEGQKKKVLLAASLMTPAHLYIWDEPLNYIDVFSRLQIEQLILNYQPTMLLVDHDVKFREHIATRVVEL
ncbi:MAG: ABC-F family ATP-binding cassette domain-containing protein [Clostridia bacterium]|nr:ABC-F family ATP-binding cassette domain-containing protein [Clostridia bacterium]